MLSELLMQSDKQNFLGEPVSPVAYQLGGDYMNYSPAAPEQSPTSPFHGIQLQPSEICPKNFIIFDQTDHKSRIMYHPVLRQKFTRTSIDIHAAFQQGDDMRKDMYTDNTESSSSMKEDTRDIDALMSLEEEDIDEDDEAISTARTFGNNYCSSPDSCSSNSSKLRASSGCCSSNENNEKQRQRMKKMVKALRGIVPGAETMTTAALIDEAVIYLKSLKVEVKRLGAGKFKN